MIVDVALPIPVEKRFSYSVPSRWAPFAQKYSRVAVPFHNKSLTGSITEIREGEGEELKEIQGVVDLFPLVSERLGRLADYASRYYVTPMGLVLKYALPSNLQIEKYLAVRMEGEPSIDGVPIKKAASRLGRTAIMEYRDEGRLTVHDVFGKKSFEPFAESRPGSEGRDTILYVGNVKDRLARYLTLISDRLAKNENVLMLLPDYDHSGAYFFRAFREAFPGRVLWYSARVTPKSRMETYFRARSEGGYLILGNKSCIFLAIARLGLVVVERPEEDLYRNEENFRFNAATLATKRAELENIPLLFGTVAPSMEVLKDVEDRRFTLADESKPTERTWSELPLEKKLVAYDGLPDDLVQLIRAGIEARRRVAVYTPRKDYSGFIQCIECKTVFSCSICNGIMSYRKSKDCLVCSACGRQRPYVEQCSQCGSSLIRISRVGVEYLEEKARLLFPHVPVVKITGDSTKKEIDAFLKTSVDSPMILVGTQALARVYDGGARTLVLVGWEELARIGGYRAHEKMFHVLTHLLDALDPEEVYFCMERKKRFNPALFLDLSGFCKDEMERRRIAGFPPYERFFLVEANKRTEKAGIKTVERIRQILEDEGYRGEIIGPLHQRKERHHWRLILKGHDEVLYKALLRLYDLADVHIEADPLYL